MEGMLSASPACAVSGVNFMSHLWTLFCKSALWILTFAGGFCGQTTPHSTACTTKSWTATAAATSTGVVRSCTSSPTTTYALRLLLLPCLLSLIALQLTVRSSGPDSCRRAQRACWGGVESKPPSVLNKHWILSAKLRLVNDSTKAETEEAMPAC